MNITWCMDALHIHHLSITSYMSSVPLPIRYFYFLIKKIHIQVFSMHLLNLKNLSLNKKILKKF